VGQPLFFYGSVPHLLVCRFACRLVYPMHPDPGKLTSFRAHRLVNARTFRPYNFVPHVVRPYSSQDLGSPVEVRFVAERRISDGRVCSLSSLSDSPCSSTVTVTYTRPRSLIDLQEVTNDERSNCAWYPWRNRAEEAEEIVSGLPSYIILR
jgi:hypothetical protein